MRCIGVCSTISASASHQSHTPTFCPRRVDTETNTLSPNLSQSRSLSLSLYLPISLPQSLPNSSFSISLDPNTNRRTPFKTRRQPDYLQPPLVHPEKTCQYRSVSILNKNPPSPSPTKVTTGKNSSVKNHVLHVNKVNPHKYPQIPINTHKYP